eukprot:762052-Hanusia_phi.AAC.3
MAEDALQAAMELLDRMEDAYTELVRRKEQHRLVVKKSDLDEQRHQVTVRENAQLRKQLSMVAAKLKLGLKEIETLSNLNAEINRELIHSVDQCSILSRKLEEQEAEWQMKQAQEKHAKEQAKLRSDYEERLMSISLSRSNNSSTISEACLQQKLNELRERLQEGDKEKVKLRDEIKFLEAQINVQTIGKDFPYGKKDCINLQRGTTKDFRRSGRAFSTNLRALVQKCKNERQGQTM